MAALLSHYLASSPDDAAARLTTLTHTCGYTRGWLDPLNPLLVWYLPTCPADAAIASLKATIPGFVTNQAQAASTIGDPFEQVQAIINYVTDDASKWIDANAYTHLAAFLHAIPRLRPFILQEMITQGIVQ
jgi:hypothetical protein